MGRTSRINYIVFVIIYVMGVAAKARAAESHFVDVCEFKCTQIAFLDRF